MSERGGFARELPRPATPARRARPTLPRGEGCGFRRHARREGGAGGRVAAVALIVAGLLLACPALAGPVLDRVKAAKALSCAAEARAGIAEVDEAGAAKGLAVDLCRAVAVAVLGPAGGITFTLLDSAKGFDALREGRIDLAFLAGGTILAEHLADRLLPGPPVYVGEDAVMVPASSAVRALRDLRGKSVCFMIGTGAERALEAALEREHVEIERSGYQEEVELRDAYNVGRCVAVAGEATFLAEVRQDGGVRSLKSRILDAPLALDPLYLATGVDDARWSAIASWTFEALALEAAPRSDYAGAGAGPLAAAVTPLGFRDGWLDDVGRTVGTYADIWRRNLGSDSDLKLAAGPNAAWPEGLMVVPQSP